MLDTDGGETHSRSDHCTNEDRGPYAHAFMEKIQETDCQCSESTGKHSEQHAMMYVYYDFADDPDRHPDQYGQKCIGQDNGCTNPAGPTGSHYLHDDNKHGTAENKRGKQDVHLRGKPGCLAITPTLNIFARKLRSFNIFGKANVRQVRKVFLFFSIGTFFTFLTLFTAFFITFAFLVIFIFVVLFVVFFVVFFVFILFRIGRGNSEVEESTGDVL